MSKYGTVLARGYGLAKPILNRPPQLLQRLRCVTNEVVDIAAAARSRVSWLRLRVTKIYDFEQASPPMRQSCREAFQDDPRHHVLPGHVVASVRRQSLNTVDAQHKSMIPPATTVSVIEGRER